MRKSFSSLSDAEEFYAVDYFSEDPLIAASIPTSFSTPQRSSHSGNDSSVDSLSPLFFSPPHGSSPVAPRSDLTVGDAIVEVCMLFKKMSFRLKKQLVTHLFRQLLKTVNDDFGFLKYVGKDFLDVSVEAVRNLYRAGKSNLVYLLSECFQTSDNESATDNVNTRLPLDRMPFGLLDYNIRFFSAEHTVRLEIEPHYAKWLETMYAHFGHKWMCLFRGPTWQYEEECTKDDEKEVDLVEMALQVSDISLFDEQERDEDTGDETVTMGEEFSVSEEREKTGEKRKRDEQIVLEGNADVTAVVESSSSSSINVSTLWSRLNQDDIEEMSEGMDILKVITSCHNAHVQKCTMVHLQLLQYYTKVN